MGAEKRMAAGACQAPRPTALLEPARWATERVALFLEEGVCRGLRRALGVARGL